jgi:cytochrome c oxidase subunit 2
MHIDNLEKRWLYVALGMIVLFVGAMFYTAVTHNVHPPGHVETIDSASLHLSEEFAEDKLGVQPQPLADGSLQVKLVAARYGFYPRQIVLPAGRKVVFRLATLDVLHGIHVPMTNMSTMVVPGFVATVNTSFPKPGEYPMLCNEYCGLGHDNMWGKLTVVSPDTWKAPTTTGVQQ